MLAPRAGIRLFILRKMLLLIFLYALAPAVYAARADSLPAPNLREKDVRKGEIIVAQLRRLENLTAASPDFKTYRALVNRIYPDLFVKVSELQDSDLKTDLTTAAFFYEEALSGLSLSIGGKIDCEDELRDAYARVCVEGGSDTAASLLWAKARLHTAWADALLKYHRGADDEATRARLEEMRNARRIDLALAASAVAALKTLERDVCAYSSLAEFEERGALATVPFEQLSKEVAGVLQSVDRVLRSLPRGPLFYPIYHARNSYHDGVFWWRKTYSRRKLVVDANSFTEPDAQKSFNLDENVVNYTVAINWRKAIIQTRRAATLIETLKSKSKI